MEDDSVEKQKSYHPIAFKINYDELEKYRLRIKNVGLKIEVGHSRIQGEGASLYFYDYDNHLFELHTGTLVERLARYCNS